MQKQIFICLAIGIFGMSCTEEIQFDLNEEGFERIVVEGFITDQVKSHEIKLTRTTSFFNEEEPESVSGAVVTISNSLNEWVLTEDPIGSGKYYTPSDAYGTQGLNHQLTIEFEDQTYSAVDYMNDVPDLDSLYVEYQVPDEDDEDDEGWWGVVIWTIDSPGTVDYYRWRTLINGVTDGDTTRYSSYSNDVGFDGAVVEDYIIEGYSFDAMSPGDTIILEQHGISEAYYDMIRAVLEQTEFQGGLFDPPPANVPTNMTNGALGFFAASSVSEKMTIVGE